MGKNTEDYLKEGIYGTQLPKQAERDRFLGTLRERILIALTIGQVMTGKGMEELELEMKAHPNASLLLNGSISHNYFKNIRDLAKQRNIPYTSIMNEEKETDIGVVLTLAEAIEREEIFIKNEDQEIPVKSEPDKSHSFLTKVKSWFS